MPCPALRNSDVSIRRAYNVRHGRVAGHESLETHIASASPKRGRSAHEREVLSVALVALMAGTLPSWTLGAAYG